VTPAGAKLVSPWLLAKANELGMANRAGHTEQADYQEIDPTHSTSP
jgi:hypothetical protein